MINECKARLSAGVVHLTRVGMSQTSEEKNGRISIRDVILTMLAPLIIGGLSAYAAITVGQAQMTATIRHLTDEQLRVRENMKEHVASEGHPVMRERVSALKERIEEIARTSHTRGGASQ